MLRLLSRHALTASVHSRLFMKHLDTRFFMANNRRIALTPAYGLLVALVTRAYTSVCAVRPALSHFTFKFKNFTANSTLIFKYLFFIVLQLTK
jgi:hypothetical protein